MPGYRKVENRGRSHGASCIEKLSLWQIIKLSDEKGG